MSVDGSYWGACSTVPGRVRRVRKLGERSVERACDDRQRRERHVTPCEHDDGGRLPDHVSDHVLDDHVLDDDDHDDERDPVTPSAPAAPR